MLPKLTNDDQCKRLDVDHIYYVLCGSRIEETHPFLNQMMLRTIAAAE